MVFNLLVVVAAAGEISYSTTKTIVMELIDFGL